MYESIISILDGIKNQIIAEYNSKGIKASGRFARNMTIGRQGRYKVVLTLPFYSQFIMKFKSNKGGRGPGKFPPIKALMEWVRVKGLQIRDLKTGRFRTKNTTSIKQVAYLIGRKIAIQGTDIHLGKRQPIDLDKIINNRLDYKGEELADRILQQIKI